jgi:hypothetical protein
MQLPKSLSFLLLLREGSSVTDSAISLHDLLIDLKPDEVERLARSETYGERVRRHIARCEYCKRRKDELLDNQLTQLDEKKRHQILDLGRRLALKVAADENARRKRSN